jgi:hypothetical protein
MTTKYHLTLVPHYYCIISKHPWNKGELIGEFTTDEAYSAAMDLMMAQKKQHPHEKPLSLYKTVNDVVPKIEVFAPDELDDVA